MIFQFETAVPKSGTFNQSNFIIARVRNKLHNISTDNMKFNYYFVSAISQEMALINYSRLLLVLAVAQCSSVAATDLLRSRLIFCFFLWNNNYLE